MFIARAYHNFSKDKPAIHVCTSCSLTCRLVTAWWSLLSQQWDWKFKHHPTETAPALTDISSLISEVARVNTSCKWNIGLSYWLSIRWRLSIALPPSTYIPCSLSLSLPCFPSQRVFVAGDIPSPCICLRHTPLTICLRFYLVIWKKIFAWVGMRARLSPRWRSSPPVISRNYITVFSVFSIIFLD